MALTLVAAPVVARPPVQFACTIRGDAGPNVLLGTPERDDIWPGVGDDYVEAGAGDDAVYDSLGDDVFLGGPGADRMIGNMGDDRLIGGGGPDMLYGGPGRDVLLGGYGNDRLFSWSWSQVEDHEQDIVNGGKGFDKAKYEDIDKVKYIEVRL